MSKVRRIVPALVVGLALGFGAMKPSHALFGEDIAIVVAAVQAAQAALVAAVQWIGKSMFRDLLNVSVQMDNLQRTLMSEKEIAAMTELARGKLVAGSQTQVLRDAAQVRDDMALTPYACRIADSIESAAESSAAAVANAEALQKILSGRSLENTNSVGEMARLYYASERYGGVDKVGPASLIQPKTYSPEQQVIAQIYTMTVTDPRPPERLPESMEKSAVGNAYRMQQFFYQQRMSMAQSAFSRIYGERVSPAQPDPGKLPNPLRPPSTTPIFTGTVPNEPIPNVPNTGGPITGGPNTPPPGGGAPASGNYPVVGFATQLIPPPPEQTVIVNGRIDLRPGNVGGPVPASGAGCTTGSYQVAIPADVTSGNWTMLLMQPGQSMSYAFRPSIQGDINTGIGTWQFTPKQANGPIADIFATISTSPCDFDYAKRDAGDRCHAIDRYGIYLLAGIITPAEYARQTGATNVCTLDPAGTYYLNVRWEAPDQRRGVDSCGALPPPNGFCAMTVSP